MSGRVLLSFHQRHSRRRAGNGHLNRTAIAEKSTTMSDSIPSAKSSVLNLRLDDETKALIAGEAIRDGRSMSQIALRAIKLGLQAMIAPAPAPSTKATKATKGQRPAAPAAPTKPRKK